MKCPECKTELTKLQVKFSDGQTKEIFGHPDTIKECPYKKDGLEVKVTILDNFIMETFQKLVAESGLNEPQEALLVPEAQIPTELNHLQEIKKRLSIGKISCETFDRILTRLEHE